MAAQVRTFTQAYFYALIALGPVMVSPTILAQSPSSPEARLTSDLMEIWSGKRLRRGKTAIYVVDAESGEPLFGIHEDELLNPASNVKLLATATMLDELGPTHRFSTRLVGPLPETAGIIDGSIYLRGSADPTLRLRHLDELVGELHRRGIRRIRGDIVAGDNDLRDALAHPGIRVAVAGTRPRQPPTVSIDPVESLFTIDNRARTVVRRRGRIRIEIEETPGGVPGDPRFILHVRGTVRQGRVARVWRKIGRPSWFTAHALRDRLAKNGITVDGSVRLSTFDDFVADAASEDFLPVEIARHESDPIAALIKTVNKRSHNFLADRLLMLTGAAVRGGLPAMRKGLDVAYRWAGSAADIGNEAMVVDTGSGLSYATKMSARQVVEILRAAVFRRDHDSIEANHSSSFVASLAVAGSDGTLRRRFRDSSVRGQLFGKTGTLTRVIALSGLLLGADNKSLCFAIITNGHRHRLRQRIRQEHEELVEAMHRYLVEYRRPAGVATSAAASHSNDRGEETPPAP